MRKLRPYRCDFSRNQQLSNYTCLSKKFCYDFSILCSFKNCNLEIQNWNNDMTGGRFFEPNSKMLRLKLQVFAVNDRWKFQNKSNCQSWHNNMTGERFFWSTFQNFNFKNQSFHCQWPLTVSKCNWQLKLT